MHLDMPEYRKSVKKCQSCLKLSVLKIEKVLGILNIFINNSYLLHHFFCIYESQDMLTKILLELYFTKFSFKTKYLKLIFFLKISDVYKIV